VQKDAKRREKTQKLKCSFPGAIQDASLSGEHLDTLSVIHEEKSKINSKYW
jgi:hypothetical protein